MQIKPSFFDLIRASHVSWLTGLVGFEPYELQSSWSLQLCTDLEL